MRSSDSRRSSVGISEVSLLPSNRHEVASVREDSVAIGPYVLPPLGLLILGAVATVCGFVMFPPVRSGAWLVALGIGAGLGGLTIVAGVALAGRGPRGFARKVMAVLSVPGIVIVTLGAFLLANGAADRSEIRVHDVTPRNVRQTNVEGDGYGHENTLVDCDDWAAPGATLTLRFEHGAYDAHAPLRVRTRAGALGIEWWVR